MTLQLPEAGDLFVGRYEILDVLGRGGFACVYRARDLQVERVVALKVLAPNDGEYSKLSTARFVREAKVIAGLQSPHTITLYDFGESPDGLFWMAYEFVDGRHLGIALAENGPLNERIVIHILEQLLRSLSEAHAAGLVHRDIKPANILVFEYQGDPWRVKLLDFGLARPTDPDATKLTRTGKTTGTPRYMSPEQVMALELGPESDLYSLGLVMFELLTARPAIDGDTMKELLQKQLRGEPIRVPVNVAGPGLRAVVERLCIRRIDERFQSAADVRRALRGIRAGLSSTSRSAKDRDPTFARAPASRWLVIVAVLAMVFVVFIVVAALLPGPTPERAPEIEVPVLPSPAAPTPVSAPPAEAPDMEVVSKRIIRDDQCPSEPGLKVRDIGGWMLGGKRRVTSYVPPSFDRNNRPAVVVLFSRGGGVSPMGFVREMGFEALADRHNLILIAPVAKRGFGRSWFTDLAISEAWNDVEAAREHWCIPDAPVFVVGQEAGARGVDQLLCLEYVDVAAAVVMSHRWQLEKHSRWCEPKSPVPYLHLEELKDGGIPAEGGSGRCHHNAVLSFEEQQAVLHRRYRCKEEGAPHPEWRFAGGDCTMRQCAAPIVTCRIDAGRFTTAVPPNPDCSGRSATPEEFPYHDVIWSFLDRHRPE